MAQTIRAPRASRRGGRKRVGESGPPPVRNHRMDLLDPKLRAESSRQAGGRPPDRLGLGVGQLIEGPHMPLGFDKHIAQRPAMTMSDKNQIVLEDEGPDQRASTTVFLADQAAFVSHVDQLRRG